jgi:LysR family glycine cleavage system transcriptional activator
MRRRLPPLHALAVFEAAARHNSFSKAAEELCVTHSAVSHQIKQLEEHLGVRMFVRLARAVALTKRRKKILIEVQAALESLESASLSISRNERARTLRVNVLQPFAGNWLVERLEEFLQDHPEIDLELEATHREDARALDEVDISVRYGKGEWKGIDFVKLLNVDLFPVCSPLI